MPAARAGLGRALALGLMHGPAELLPISSSGHIELVPWLLGGDGVSSDPEVRKAFEVALHAGTAAALVVILRDEVIEAAREINADSAAVVALSLLPPVIIGFALERPIERFLGKPGTIAVGLIAGAVALARSDREPQQRGFDEATPRDGFWLGIGQACALFPGVSRNGATLTAARLRRFTRVDAERLSRHVALPVIGGATALKCLRLWQRGLPEGAGPAFAVGVVASFASTLAATPLIDLVERDRSLLPFAAYRVALGSAALRKLRRDRRRKRGLGATVPGV
ncbi:MAG TPA: undecaprenyl-diphosphate phosphatase [Solirubrobacteraceae bacterium]|jgi:undecaprenyl-diphosphatase|nr:undecaprenyl-diphosphate phosphatase [Solirubrobacteraceae bacterium]